MRNSFVSTLLEEAKKDSDIVLLTGDLGFGVFEEFASELPLQFINTGVAEQAMIGIAAGLASTGKRCFTYSIANFATMRCLEQIRTDVCYHSLPVTIVAVGAGLSYGSLGYTHHAIEDIAVMRALPNLTIGSPSDDLQTVSLTKYFASNLGPGYLRLGNFSDRVSHNLDADLSNQLPIKVREGKDLAILSTGVAVNLAQKAAEIISQENCLDIEVWSFPFIKPFHKPTLFDICSRHSRVITVEEHVLAGGFGSLVLENAAEIRQTSALITCVGLNELPIELVGNSDYLRMKRGLSIETIVAEVKVRCALPT